jgi:transposase-like protein
VKAQRLIQLPVLEGEQAPSAKLSRANAQEIKTALAEGTALKELAAAFGISYQTVYLIGLGKIWKSIEPSGRVLPERSRVTPELRDRMFAWKRKRGATNREVSERFGVSTSAVSRAMKDGYAIFALRIQRAVLSSGTYEQVARKFGIKRKDIEEFLAFVSDGGISERLKAEVD